MEPGRRRLPARTVIQTPHEKPDARYGCWGWWCITRNGRERSSAAVGWNSAASHGAPGPSPRADDAGPASVAGEAWPGRKKKKTFRRPGGIRVSASRRRHHASARCGWWVCRGIPGARRSTTARLGFPVEVPPRPSFCRRPERSDGGRVQTSAPPQQLPELVLDGTGPTPDLAFQRRGAVRPDGAVTTVTPGPGINDVPATAY